MKPKRLTLPEMWNLYQILKNGLDKTVHQNYFADEIIFLMENVDTESFKKSLQIMYGYNLNYLDKSPYDIGMMFLQGVRHNKLFEFSEAIKGMYFGYSK